MVDERMRRGAGRVLLAVAGDDDDWTVVTLDGSWSAHTEHTVAVTDHGPEVLTRN